MTSFSYLRMAIRPDKSAEIETTAPDGAPDLRAQINMAHTMAAALDALASEIALECGLDPDSDTISEAIYVETDLDAALALLESPLTKGRPQ